ncbi:VOC family protein [Amycolatopsis magusensis]|uniref:Catechol 2,3-dioxygenase-like lactoylglutathione lyase family enzyme n=1 Tax=Amycolatopsis magusensis TaxID=882444 RepID=A0ABS4PHR7_9PSEU|nr:VOC family protein [Amycolatopsis magusensis]MBP2178935.1 catechol 2,3-dioxygenase-like lactoylglutathione lyase family enzyme [Amycolatopsis magusensis]MDI5975242.1 VOC family protein [Amycolatopsis magusensis]
MEKTIPLLPCVSITETLDFYCSLGFEVTYRQKAPNVYAVVDFEGVELHFYVLKGLAPQDNFSTCYVLTDRVDVLYERFTGGLRAALGKVPSRGTPRVNPLKNLRSGARQFIVIDPSGNYVRIGQPFSAPNNGLAEGPVEGPKLGRVLETATMLADSRDDPHAAVRTLDRALALDEEVPAVLRFRALVLRTDLALRLGDEDGARALLSEVDGFGPVGDGEAADEVRRVEELREQLTIG